MASRQTNASGRWLHWAVAISILAALATGYVLTNTESFSLTLLRAHLAFGATAGLLALLRVVLRVLKGPPAPVFQVDSRLQKLAAGLVHVALRLIPLALFVSGAGMIAVSGLLPSVADGTLTGLSQLEALPPRALHHAAALALAVLVGLHGVAALWHGLRRPAASPA